LYVEANEPYLDNRRTKLGMQYATKLKAYPSNQCCRISIGFVSDFLYCVNSRLKEDFEFNHGGFSGITIGAMSSKFISEFAMCDFTRSPKG
jgi:hypothetical protein